MAGPAPPYTWSGAEAQEADRRASARWGIVPASEADNRGRVSASGARITSMAAITSMPASVASRARASAVLSAGRNRPKGQREGGSYSLRMEVVQDRPTL